jgi:hypothetical protein
MQLKNTQNIWEGLKGMQESRAYLDWRWTWVNTFSNLCELMSKKKELLCKQSLGSNGQRVVQIF